MIYEFPERTPKLTRKILTEILSNVHSIIGNSLVGIYVYGSLAMGCFRLESSDVDIILVTEERLEKEKSKRIIDYLKGTCSKERRIEMSIITLATVRKPRYPMLVDLHYEYWGNIFENKKDSEILSNLYTTKERGFCIWGRSISDVFSGIPALYHLRSVIEDIRHTRRYLHDNPEHAGYNVAVYWVLSSCRILAFMREEKVLSKLEGGQWGLANLPKKYHDLIEQALSCYQGEKKETLILAREELEEFADYMTEAILKENKL
jgi:predicted nucleotidyltransferase